MPIQKPTLPAPSPLDLADPFHAPEAVRRRIRRKWERRRASTSSPTILTVLKRRHGFDDPRLPSVRVVPGPEEREKLLASHKLAGIRFAMVERVER